MELEFKEKALRDIEFWKHSGQVQIQNKISSLLNDILEHPYIGLSKPEQLKFNLVGYWSRRISFADRIVYRVDQANDVIYILSLRGHYEL